MPKSSYEAQDTKALRETRVLQDFYNMLSQDSSRAFYGPGHIRASNELGAIATLLITDTVLLVHDVKKVPFRVPTCMHFSRLVEFVIFPVQRLKG